MFFWFMLYFGVECRSIFDIFLFMCYFELLKLIEKGGKNEYL